MERERIDGCLARAEKAETFGVVSHNAGLDIQRNQVRVHQKRSRNARRSSGGRLKQSGAGQIRDRDIEKRVPADIWIRNGDPITELELVLTEHDSLNIGHIRY